MATDVGAPSESTSMPSLSGELSRQILDPPPTHPSSFAFADFLKREYRFGVDPNRPVCKAFLQGHCPLGNECPDRHTVSSSFNNLVCKHWLRGLCKKGEACEFLHEYNLRKMPECNFFVRNGYCSNGDECLYLHIDPDSKLPPCPHYERGFCPLGPNCSKKHVRKTMCKYYLAGFCPNGARQCKEGAHPKWSLQKLPPPTVKVKKDPEEERERVRELRERDAEREEERDRQSGGGGSGRREWGGRGQRRFFRGGRRGGDR